jgi:hypothetical protein
MCDLLRRPAVSLSLFAAIAVLTTLMAVVLLLDQTVKTATERLMTQAPDLVLRRVNSGGWAPLPVEESLSLVRKVAGVLNPRVRVWGGVHGPQRPVVVVGARRGGGVVLPSDLPYPNLGECLAGPGVSTGNVASLLLRGSVGKTFALVGRLPVKSGMATHDVVVVHEADARLLLGLSAHQASDLAMDVFHEDEADALLPVLAAAFPWPVQLTTRQEQMQRHLNLIAQRSSAAWLTFIPALLAMATLAAAVGLLGGQRKENGLLKALGWTGGDILRLHLFKGLLVGSPAVGLGVALAHALLFLPGMTWVTQLMFGWHQAPPALYLSAIGAVAALGLAGLMVGLPFMAAVFWTGWRAAAVDAADAVEGGI